MKCKRDTDGRKFSHATLQTMRQQAVKVAILDIASRKVLAWRLSNTLTADFCVEALAEALSRYGPPEIFNTDQGAQFTAEAMTSELKIAGVRSAWTAKAAGSITCSSSGSGAASNTKRFICKPMRLRARPAKRSDGTLRFTTPPGGINRCPNASPRRCTTRCWRPQIAVAA